MTITGNNHSTPVLLFILFGVPHFLSCLFWPAVEVGDCFDCLFLLGKDSHVDGSVLMLVFMKMLQIILIYAQINDALYALFGRYDEAGISAVYQMFALVALQSCHFKWVLLRA